MTVLDKQSYNKLVVDIYHGAPAEPHLDDVNDTTRHQFYEWKGEDEVHFFRINYGPEHSKESDLLNFSFDYAAKCTDEEAEEITEKIKAWRQGDFKSYRQMFDELEELIEKYDHFTAFWV